MDIRDQKQYDALQMFEYCGEGIINAAPRFGKIKVAIDIIKRQEYRKVLICYPRNDIEDGWLADFTKWGLDFVYITFSTYTSLDKIDPKEFDFIILDEIHEASLKQLDVIAQKIKGKRVLGLSGTMTNKTKGQIRYKTGLDVIYYYPIEEAVKDGVLCDYEILIHRVVMSGEEGKAFGKYKYVKAKLEKENKPTFFLDLKMIGLIQNSPSKLRKTREIIQKYRDERILVFCGTTAIADSLGIPAYHSKKKEKDIFQAFCNGEGKHLATVKMMQAGITVTPINKGLISYTSGNPEDSAQKICRFLGIEYDTPEKKAEIHIVCTNEPFEVERLNTALMFFDSSKIKLAS